MRTRQRSQVKKLQLEPRGNRVARADETPTKRTHRIILLTLQLSRSYARSSSVSPIFLLLSPGTQIKMLPSARLGEDQLEEIPRSRAGRTYHRRPLRAPRLCSTSMSVSVRW